MKDNKSSKVNGERELGRFPLLPLRDIVVFPHMVVPLFVGRQKSVLALEAAMTGGRHIFLATQKSAKTEEPLAEDIHTEGTICQIIQLLKLPDGTVKVLVEGKRRGSIVTFLQGHEYFIVAVDEFEETVGADTSAIKALMRETVTTFESYLSLTKTNLGDLPNTLDAISDPLLLADTVAAHLNVKVADRQDLLAIRDNQPRLEKLIALISAEIEILQIEKKIRTRVKKQMEKSQKEYYLNEQLRAIQKELGSKDDSSDEFRELEGRITGRKMSKEAAEKALGELKKLKMMSPVSAEAAIIRNYIDSLLALPWGNTSKVKTDINEAERILDQDHFGLGKVKLRVLEYLAVHALTRKVKGPILCLVGPPGVGKTSLVRSIARATGRNFVKMSLGGVRDEAEIRGHRRTYVGAMPGRIIAGLKKAGTGNPVFLLDEIDKMSSDFRGDPSAALLEVLDPEQNAHFGDHFLDVEYDLSQVMFIATANSLHGVPRPLLDRLEVIRLEGYAEMEKQHIARKYLLEKQLAANGLKDSDLHITDGTLVEIIRHYTREAGVRGLEREIANLCRKIAHRIVKGGRGPFTVKPKQLEALLGSRRYRFDKAEGATDPVGVVNGLAWTESGGEILTVEVVVLPGRGKLIITGKLGDVMHESAQAALSYVRSRAQILGIDKDFYHTVDVHVHVPEGAIPKDGPSAGITMATAIISALTGKAVSRDLAMTGEITLQGRVLAIGGLKDKLLAARRSGIKTVLIPRENEKDLADIPAEAKKSLTVTPVEHMDDVVGCAILSDLAIRPDMGGAEQLPDAGQEIVTTH